MIILKLGILVYDLMTCPYEVCPQ